VTTDPKLLIIVPTRSRPQNVAKVVKAWEDTGAFEDGAELCFAHDRDDPAHGLYHLAIASTQHQHHPKVRSYSLPKWVPMVHKLNDVAKLYATYYPEYSAIGFAGDDHLPRTKGWAGRYLAELTEMGTGIVSCPDGYRRDDLPTQWAMTANIVRALGRMVPAPVEHLYCDDAIRDLAKAAGCWRYLDDVLIEHVHPAARKAEWDDQYLSVNRREQFRNDRVAYRGWTSDGCGRDAETVRALRSSASGS
jgi:hypothetical protein